MGFRQCRARKKNTYRSDDARIMPARVVLSKATSAPDEVFVFGTGIPSCAPRVSSTRVVRRQNALNFPHERLDGRFVDIVNPILVDGSIAIR